MQSGNVSLAIDYNLKSKAVSLKVNGKETLEADGIVSSVEVEETGTAMNTGSLAVSPTVAVSGSVATISGIRYADSSLEVTETWTLTADGSNIKWEVGKKYDWLTGVPHPVEAKTLGFTFDQNAFDTAYRGDGGSLTLKSPADGTTLRHLAPTDYYMTRFGQEQGFGWSGGNIDLVDNAGNSVLSIGMTSSRNIVTEVSRKRTAPYSLIVNNKLSAASFSHPQRQGYAPLYTSYHNFDPDTAPDRVWNFDASVEGWTASPHVGGFAWQTGGSVGGSIAGNDPWIMSPDNLNLDPSKYRLLKIRLKNGTSATKARVYFTTAGEPSWNQDKSVAFDIKANDAGMTEYTIDLLPPVVYGDRTIKQIRIDPIDDASVTVGAFSVDRIKLGSFPHVYFPAQVADLQQDTAVYTIGAATNRDKYYDVGSFPAASGIDETKFARFLSELGRTAIFDVNGDGSWNSLRSDFLGTMEAQWAPEAILGMQAAEGNVVTLQALRELAENSLSGQWADGHIPGCLGGQYYDYPDASEGDAAIPLVAAAYINATRDASWAGSVKSGIRKALDYALSKDTDQDGLVEDHLQSNYTRREQGWLDQQYQAGEDGFVNALLYGALTEWAEIERLVLGDATRANQYKNKAAALKTRYNMSIRDGGLWSDKHNGFVGWRNMDGNVEGDVKFLHVDAAAIKYGLATDEHADRILYAPFDGYDNIEDYMTRHNIKSYPINLFPMGQGEIYDGQENLFPNWQNGDVFPHIAGEMMAAYARQGSTVPVKYLKNLIDLYYTPGDPLWTKDVFSWSFGTNLFGCDYRMGVNMQAAATLITSVFGIVPKYDYLLVNPAIMDASLHGSEIKYTMRGHQYRIRYDSDVKRTLTQYDGAEPVRFQWNNLLPGTVVSISDNGTAYSRTANAEGIVSYDIASAGAHTVTLSGAAYKTRSFPAATGKAWHFHVDKEGWTAPHDIAGFAYQIGGYAGGTIAGGDPYVVSPDQLSVDLSAAKTVKIRMKNGSTSALGEIYFTTEADTAWNDTKHAAFKLVPDDANYTEYVVDMSAVPGWSGRLKQLRIDPGNGVGAGSFSIDYVSVEAGSDIQTSVEAGRAGATASSQFNAGLGAANATDNDSSTIWSSSLQSQTGSQWLTLDLKAAFRVDRVKLVPRAQGGSVYAFPKDFKLQTSLDGTAFVDVPGQSYTSYPAPSAPGADFVFAGPVQARYVRVVGTKFGTDDVGNYAMQLAEIYAFGAGRSGLYASETGFGSVQGLNQWNFEEWSWSGNARTVRPMTWDSANKRWKGNAAYSLIGDSWQAPDVNSESVRVFTAPRAGDVRITGEIRRLFGAAGNGVLLKIKKNDASFWPQNADYVAMTAWTGMNVDLTTHLNAGDQLQFVVNSNGDSSYDTVNFNVNIEYQN